MTKLKIYKVIKVLLLLIGFGIFHIIVTYYPWILFGFVVLLILYVSYVMISNKLRNKD